jgi:2-phosphoglycerate kinase
VGKTSVSYRLAHRYGVGIAEVDDFQVILERMTTPDQQPVVHFFRTRPDEWERIDEEQRLAFGIDYAGVMAGALELVIANHPDGGVPVVLEGDFVLPSLAVRPSYDGVPSGGQVRALFLYEDDEGQLARNYLAREGRPRPERPRASWRYSERLRREGERLGVPTVAARPWGTVFERANAALVPTEPSLLYPPVSP